MDKLLKPAYYFSIAPGSFEFSKLTLAAVVLFFVCALAIRLLRRRMGNVVLKKMVRRYPERLLVFGSILLVLLLFREANMPFLSMRIWFVAWGLWFVYWLVRSIFTFNKEYRKRLEDYHHTNSQNKYLPRKKH